MVNTFINPSLGPASKLGVGLFEDMSPIELRPGFSEVEVQVAIRAAYRQVFGNAYIMESERLTAIESMLRFSEINVREFVRQLAQSERYQSCFFDQCSRYRFIELNFKHLLGRAPINYEEMVEHSKILDDQGYIAEINSYVDSEEYISAFGDATVPFYRGHKTQTGLRAVSFPHMFQLLRGAPASDKDLQQRQRPKLQSALLRNQAHPIILPLGFAGRRTDQDLRRLIAEAVKPSPQVQAQYAQYQTGRALEQKYQEQVELLKTLQQQIFELQSLAAVGENITKKWQRLYSPPPATGGSFPQPRLQQSGIATVAAELDSGATLQERVEQQAKAIEAAEKRISELRSLAVLAEGYLNRWRTRTFARR